MHLDTPALEGWHVTHLVFQRCHTPLRKPGGPRPLRELHNHLPPTRAAPGSKKAASACRSPRPVRRRCVKRVSSGGRRPSALAPPPSALANSTDEPIVAASLAPPLVASGYDGGSRVPEDTPPPCHGPGDTTGPIDPTSPLPPPPDHPRVDSLAASSGLPLPQPPYGIISLFDGCGSTRRSVERVVGYQPAFVIAAEMQADLRPVVAECQGYSDSDQWCRGDGAPATCYAKDVRDPPIINTRHSG